MLKLIVTYQRRRSIIRMKKVGKVILSILLIIILAAAGTIYYFLNVKTYDVADEKVEEIIETEYEIILPDDIEGDDISDVNMPYEGNNNKSGGTEGVSTENANENDFTDDKEINNTPVNSAITSKPVQTKEPKAKTTKDSTVVTVKNIKDKFRPVFQSLESQASNKIDAIISLAFGEYQDKKANGELISYSYFYQKYTAAGRDLESKTDSAFEYIYTALEKDLIKYGYSATHGKVFREQYEETKKEREAALLNKAKEAL
jgi:ABC-type cobalt transport system substrate-binding protein